MFKSTNSYILLGFAFLIGIFVVSVAQGNTDNRKRLFDRIPDAVVLKMLPTGQFVGHSDLAWNAHVLNVAFEGGSHHAREIIENTADKWTSTGSLSLSFRNPDGSFRTWSRNDTTRSADIRISFRTGKKFGGYWSAIGSLAQNLAANVPTMNLEGLDSDLSHYNNMSSNSWLNSYEHSTILHEFGHAFGFAHEHFHNDCQKDLDIRKAIKELMDPPNNWTKNQAAFNVSYAGYRKILFNQSGVLAPDSGSKIDQMSIMLYGLNSKHMKSGNKSKCNVLSPRGYATDISTQDRQYPESVSKFQSSVIL